MEKDTSSYKAELNEISFSITQTNRYPAVSDERFWSLSSFGTAASLPGFLLLSETSTVTAIACPLLCSQSCYSGPFLSEL